MGSMLSVQVTANAVAWYGGVVSTISLAASLYVIWRNRARIKIEFSPNAGVFDISPSGALQSDDKEYVSVDIINVGHRPTRIEAVAFLYAGSKKNYLIKSSLSSLSNKVLTEEAPRITYPVSKSEVNTQMLYGIVVSDGTGRKFKKYTKKFPSFFRIWMWLTR